MTDIEEIDDTTAEQIHSIDNIVNDKSKIVRPGFANFAAFERANNTESSATSPSNPAYMRTMHSMPQFNPQVRFKISKKQSKVQFQFQNMSYSGLALLNQQAALRNHHMQMQTSTVRISYQISLSLIS